MTDDLPRVHGLRVIRLPSMPPDLVLIAPPDWPGPVPHTVETGETSPHEWLREIAERARVIRLTEPEPHAHVTITHVDGRPVDPGTVDPGQPPGLVGE